MTPQRGFSSQNVDKIVVDLQIMSQGIDIILSNKYSISKESLGAPLWQNPISITPSLVLDQTYKLKIDVNSDTRYLELSARA